MSETIQNVLCELGFEITHDWGRVIHASQEFHNGHTFTAFVDTQNLTIDLKCSSEIVSGFVLNRQGFVDTSALKTMLLQNRIFTRYHPNSAE
jgi:hypothetical protein